MYVAYYKVQQINFAVKMRFPFSLSYLTMYHICTSLDWYVVYVKTPLVLLLNMSAYKGNT